MLPHHSASSGERRNTPLHVIDIYTFQVQLPAWEAIAVWSLTRTGRAGAVIFPTR
jgi:hypothetical protein